MTYFNRRVSAHTLMGTLPPRHVAKVDGGLVSNRKNAQEYRRPYTSQVGKVVKQERGWKAHCIRKNIGTFKGRYEAQRAVEKMFDALCEAKILEDTERKLAG